MKDRAPKYAEIGKPGQYANDNEFDRINRINFIPIQECPFFKYQPAMTPTMDTITFSPVTKRPSNEETKNWDAVLVTVIPAILVACLVSTCYLCYRYDFCSTLKNELINLGIEFLARCQPLWLIRYFLSIL